LFVALRGARHDAHEFVPQAVAAGAAAVLVDRALEVPDGVGVFRVEDTLAALGALAAHHRRRYDVPVVAITGSVGKTSTKELVAAALRGTGCHVAATRGNLNNRVGVPMTLFTIGPEHAAVVIEIGMNVPGEIADLAAMVAPNVGVVTSVAEVHTEGVGGIEGVAREKGALLEALDENAAAIWCADEALLAPYAERSRARAKIGYGAGEAAAVRLVRWELDGVRTRASYVLPHREKALELTLAMLGQAAATNAAAALAVAACVDPDRLEDAAAALGEVAPAAHRMVPIETASGLLVIDDTYNASPRSAIAALETASLLASARGGRLVAVLGDMLELGAHAERLHAQVGREAIRAGACALIACGELMTHAGKAALAATMERSGQRAKVVLVRKPEDAAECARELAVRGDVVLVKGSRGMRMERVVDALSAEGGA
ncbi:MAG TPA: UDP-N-acetylmuramoyl-tripeptide--D-alanyl-D-alanine ligase, partial [Sandaracinaceae bacterium]